MYTKSQFCIIFVFFDIFCHFIDIIYWINAYIKLIIKNTYDDFKPFFKIYVFHTDNTQVPLLRKTSELISLVMRVWNKCNAFSQLQKKKTL